MQGFHHAVRRFFDGWAAGYDGDLARGHYDAPQAICAGVCPFLPQGQARLLDIGIGTGLSSMPFRAVRPDIHITGVDASTRMLALCKDKGIANTLVLKDAATGDLPDGAFDAAIACGVLEFLRDPLPLLGAAAARLKPGGILALAQESAGMTPIYKPGLFTGVIERRSEFVAIRRIRTRLPWPDIYIKYLHASDSIIRACTDLGLALAEARCITAYHRDNVGAIAHDLLIFRK